MPLVRVGRRRVRFAAMAALIACGQVATASPAVAASPSTTAGVTTTTTLVLPSDELTMVSNLEFAAVVAPAPSSGEVALYDVANGGHKFVWVNSVDPATGLSWLRATGPELGLGHHELVAEYTDSNGTFEASSSGPQPLDVIRAPLHLTLQASGTAMYPGDMITLTANSTDSYAGGDATFVADGPSGQITLGTRSYYYDVTGISWQLEVSSLPYGEYDITASIAESDNVTGAVSNMVTITSAKRPSNVSINASGTPQTHHPYTIFVEPYAAVPVDHLPLPTGTVTLKDGPTSLGTKPLENGAGTFEISAFTAGNHTLTASYSGDGYYAPGTGTLPLPITADVVEASNVGIQFGTFYPATDGYRDTLAIRGTRLESATVGIRIFGPSGVVVRTATLSAANGSYSYAWNGRTSAGAVLPGGFYRVVQTLTDGFATKSTFESTVNLSTKKLFTKTAYVTLSGPNFTVKGSGGGGSVTKSTAGGYVKLTAGDGGWAAAGWEFRLPAAFGYKSVSFEIDAKGGLSAPPNRFAIQNFERCARTNDWNESCFERWTSVGNNPPSRRWYATSASGSASYRSPAYVRGIVHVGFGTVYVYTARAKVVYQVWDRPIGAAVAR
jgi:hypothetical protein